MTDPSKLTNAELIAGLGNMSNRLIRAEQDNRKLTAALDEYKRQLAVSQGINQQRPVTQEQLDAAQAEVAALTTERDGLNASVKKLEAKIDELQAKNESLQTDLGELSTAAQNALQPATQPSPLEVLDELLEEPPSTIEGSPKTSWGDRRAAARKMRGK